MDETPRKVVCPSDKQSHNVVISTLPLCYAIIQHLPKIKESKEFKGCLINRLKTAESEHPFDENENIRKEFKSVLKQFTEEYKRSKLWDDAVKQLGKKLSENCHEQVSSINMAFDKAILFLNEKRQRLISELKTAYEKENKNIEREQYKRKKHLDEVHESYSELKKAEKKLNSMNNDKLFFLTTRNKQKFKVLSEKIHDFNVKTISFVDNIKFKDTGTLKIHNRVITHEGISKEARGKSVDTKMSKETLEDADFANHPKFEYDALAHSRVSKGKKKREKLKESIHNSTSPRMHRNNRSNKIINYVTSKEESYENRDSRVKDLVFQNNPKIKQNMGNYPTNKNHKSMLKLHEKGLKKVTSFYERDKSAASLGMKNHKFNIEKLNFQKDYYNKSALTKIIEAPNTERGNYHGLEPPVLKPSKSKSRYDNEILSSPENQQENKYKRNPIPEPSFTPGQNFLEYNEHGVKRSKEEMDIIKSLAKDDYNPFVINPFDNLKKEINQEHSEKVVNNKMFSRIANQIQEKNERASTMDMKDQLELIKNEKAQKKTPKESRQKNIEKWHKNSTPNVEGNRRGGELNVICEEYGIKGDEPEDPREKMVRLKDVQKDYKSSKADMKTQFNRYTSNKHSKNATRKVKYIDPKSKENENTINDTHHRRVEHKPRSRKGKVRQHKKKHRKTP